jgi:hypothetical protein
VTSSLGTGKPLTFFYSVVADGTGYLEHHEQLWLHEIEHDEQWGLLIAGLCEEGLLNHELINKRSTV